MQISRYIHLVDDLLQRGGSDESGHVGLLADLGHGEHGGEQGGDRAHAGPGDIR